MLYNIIEKQDFPQLLSQIEKPPECLYYQGDPTLLKKTCIAIVGTRKNTEYGAQITRDLVRDLAILDIAIVSGLAKGIDAIAHEQALKHNIPTIAILGCGLNNIYPLHNARLFEQIAQKGLILSEFEPETPPLQHHFPQRNRIIAGLSIATIVVEAPVKSGALITAKNALECGRDIFCFPGDVDRENSEGILNLLQYGGGFPVKNGRQIIEMLQKQPQLFKKSTKSTSRPGFASLASSPLQTADKIPSASSTSNQHPSPPLALNLSPTEKLILSKITKTTGRDFDTLRQKTGLQTQELLIKITELELKNLITAKNGRFMRLVDFQTKAAVKTA